MQEGEEKKKEKETSSHTKKNPESAVDCSCIFRVVASAAMADSSDKAGFSPSLSSLSISLSSLCLSSPRALCASFCLCLSLCPVEGMLRENRGEEKEGRVVMRPRSPPPRALLFSPLVFILSLFVFFLYSLITRRLLVDCSLILSFVAVLCVLFVLPVLSIVSHLSVSLTVSLS